MAAPLTLRKALDTKRLADFIEQKEARGVGPVGLVVAGALDEALGVYGGTRRDRRGDGLGHGAEVNGR